jgi:hypothetical protein
MQKGLPVWSEFTPLSPVTANECVSNSQRGLDLFIGVEWRNAWLAVWGAEIAKIEARLIVEPERGAIRNLYRCRTALRRWLVLDCLQFIGTSYKGVSTARSEYNDFSFDEPQQGGRREALSTLEQNPEWKMMVLSDIVSDGQLHQNMQAWCAEKGWYMRQTYSDKAWHIDVRGTWEDYLSSRSGGVRRKLLANRRKLSGNGDALRLEDIAPSELDSFLDKLNEFHVERWGVPCYGPVNRKLMKTFASAVEASPDGKLNATRLLARGETVSLMLNLQWKGRVYNLQSGFDSRFSREAPGYVHLGLAIQEAFSDNSLHTFDMLAGGGKVSDYKSDLATGHIDLCSVMIIRSALLGLGARFYYAMRRLFSLPTPQKSL